MKMIGVHIRGRFYYANQIEKDRELMRKRKLKKRKTGPEKYSNKSLKFYRYRVIDGALRKIHFHSRLNSITYINYRD